MGRGGILTCEPGWDGTRPAGGLGLPSAPAQRGTHPGWSQVTCSHVTGWEDPQRWPETPGVGEGREGKSQVWPARQPPGASLTPSSPSPSTRATLASWLFTDTQSSRLPQGLCTSCGLPGMLSPSTCITHSLSPGLCSECPLAVGSSQMQCLKRAAPPLYFSSQLTSLVHMTPSFLLRLSHR